MGNPRSTTPVCAWSPLRNVRYSTSLRLPAGQQAETGRCGYCGNLECLLTHLWNVCWYTHGPSANKSFAEQLGLPWEWPSLKSQTEIFVASIRCPLATHGQHLTFTYTRLRHQSGIQREKSEGKIWTPLRQIHLFLLSLFLLSFITFLKWTFFSSYEFSFYC